MKNIDRIFSEGLQSHTTTPSDSSWGRVESQLPAIADRVVLLRWAAVLIPLLVSAGIWMSRTAEVPDLVATKVPTQEIAVPEVSTPQVAVVSVPARKKTTSRKQKQTTPAVVVAEPVDAGTMIEVAMPEEITIEPVSLDPDPVVIEQQPIVLVYTLEPIAEPAEMTRKETSLTRVVEFARTVKHSDPISDIRGLKDELFAFDFRKKQTKKN